MTFFYQKLRMEDVSFIYFEQIVSFCAIIYKIPKGTKSLKDTVGIMQSPLMFFE